MLGHKLQGASNSVSHFFGRFNHVAGHINHPNHHVFAFQQGHHLGRHVRVVTLQAHLLDAALGQGRKHPFVLTPFVTQGFFPVVVGFDAIAVANVNGGGAGQALRGALQGFDAPVCGLVQVDVEGRLVKLDDVHAIGLQSQGLLVEQLGKGERHLDAALFALAVKTVGHGVHNGHGPGQGELEFFLSVGTGQLRFKRMHTAFEAQGRDDLRHLRVVAVVANAHGDFVFKVDAFDLL